MRKRKKIKYHLFGSGWNIIDRILDINGVLLYRLVQACIVVGIINMGSFNDNKTKAIISFTYIVLISITILVMAEGVLNNFFYAYTRERYMGHFIRDWVKEGYASAKIKYDSGMSWARLMNNNPDLEYELDNLEAWVRTRSIKWITFYRRRHELYVEYGVYNKSLDGYHFLWYQDPEWKEKRAYNKANAHEKAMLQYPNDHAYDTLDEQSRKMEESIYKTYGQEGVDASILTGKDLQKKEAELNAKRRN